MRRFTWKASEGRLAVTLPIPVTSVQGLSTWPRFGPEDDYRILATHPLTKSVTSELVSRIAVVGRPCRDRAQLIDRVVTFHQQALDYGHISDALASPPEVYLCGRGLCRDLTLAASACCHVLLEPNTILRIYEEEPTKGFRHAALGLAIDGTGAGLYHGARRYLFVETTAPAPIGDAGEHLGRQAAVVAIEPIPRLFIAGWQVEDSGSVVALRLCVGNGGSTEARRVSAELAGHEPVPLSDIEPGRFASGTVAVRTGRPPRRVPITLRCAGCPPRGEMIELRAAMSRLRA